MNNIIKYISFLILFIILTKTYVFFASLLHTTVGVTTSIVFIISILIIFFQLKDFKLEIPKKWFKALFYFVIISAVVVTVLTRNYNMNTLMLQLFYFVIFLLTYLFYSRNYGNRLMFFLFLSSLLFTIAFAFLSVVNPSFFTQYGNLINALSFYGGRAFGFYMQPNSLALAINIMYIGIIVLAPKEKYIIYLYPLIFVAILVTGSRSNFVGFAIISLFLFLYLMKRHKKEILKALRVLIPISIIIVYLSTDYLTKVFQDNQNKAMSSRIVSMFLQDNKALEDDMKSGSMAERLRYQEYYEKLIAESPLVGYGFGIQQDLMASGKLKGSSHNVVYEILLQGGIVYLMFFIFFMIFLIKNYFFIRRENIENKRLLLGYKIFLFFMLFYFFFSSTFFSERLIYVFLAIISLVTIQNNANGKKVLS